MDNKFKRRIVKDWTIFETDPNAHWASVLPSGSKFTIERRHQDFWFVPGEDLGAPFVEKKLTPDSTETKKGEFPSGEALVGALHVDFGAGYKLYFTLNKLTDNRNIISLTHEHATAKTSEEKQHLKNEHQGGKGGSIKTHGGSHGID